MEWLVASAMKKLIIALIVGAIALLGITVFVRSRASRTGGSLESYFDNSSIKVREALRAALAKARQEQQALEAERDTLQSAAKLDATKTPRSEVMPQRQRVPDDILNDLIRTSIERDYRLVFAKLDLNPTQATALRELLANWRKSPPRGDDEIRGSLQGLIGEQKSALMMLALADPVSWTRIQELDERLRFEATPLDDEQLAALMNLVSAELQMVPRPRDLAGVIEAARIKAESNARLRERATGILSPDQLKVLDEQLRADLARMRVALYKMQMDQRPER